MLNDAKLRAARPRDKAYKLTDSNRLYLLVLPSGGKSWRWSYTFDGKQKSLAMGAYPAVSLVDARLRRDEARLVLEEGRDPGVAKKLRIEENLEISRTTFELVAREWFANAKGQWAAMGLCDGHLCPCALLSLNGTWIETCFHFFILLARPRSRFANGTCGIQSAKHRDDYCGASNLPAIPPTLFTGGQDFNRESWCEQVRQCTFFDAVNRGR